MSSRKPPSRRPWMNPRDRINAMKSIELDLIGRMKQLGPNPVKEQKEGLKAHIDQSFGKIKAGQGAIDQYQKMLDDIGTGRHPEDVLIERGKMKIEEASPEGLDARLQQIKKENREASLTGAENLPEDMAEAIKKGGGRLAKTALGVGKGVAATAAKVALKPLSGETYVQGAKVIANTLEGAKIMDELKKRDPERRQNPPPDSGHKFSAKPQPENGKATPPAPQPDPKTEDRGGLGKEAVANRKALEAQSQQSEPPLRPDIQKLKEEMLKPGRPVDDILLKKPEDWTEGEVRDVMKERLRLPMNHPERQGLWEREKKWFSHFYGDGPAKADEFGRLKQPKPIRPINERPLEAQTRDGRPLTKEIDRFTRHLARAAGDTPAPELVKSLQSGINALAASKYEQKPQSALKEDGVFGPKTNSALKNAMARLGRPKLEEGAALGRFSAFAQSNRPKSYRDLREQTERGFGHLFRNPGAVGSGSSPGKQERIEATILQETLNDMGPKVLGGGYAPLKLDGDIGPKTFDAFTRVNKAAGAKSLTQRLGSFLGFI